MAPRSTIVGLDVGSAYQINGVLHDYLGPAQAMERGAIVHAFRRREWRPGTADQYPVTLVPESEVKVGVTRFGRR